MSTNLKNRLPEILNTIEQLTLLEGIQYIQRELGPRITFSTSFSFEDQVITHAIRSTKSPVRIFTLDTGRLFDETYRVWSKTIQKYNAEIEAFYPQEISIAQFVNANGPNAFYESVDHRKSCCSIRKVEPLQRALRGYDVWITGLRSEHSVGRQELPLLEWDDVNQITKYHPLLHWTSEEVREYIDRYEVPYNELHEEGFVSIGCAPCTRAIKPGENFRAGRWWWEESTKKECGLHVTN